MPVKHPTLLYEPIFLMNPFQACSDKTVKMLVYVHSAQGNLRKRLAIRKTWGSSDNLNKYKAKIVFVSGMSDNFTIADKLNMENKRYGDILQANFHDTYKNLTMKAKSAITWISKYCKNITYVLKTDDDTFVHLERLQKYIVTLETKSRPVTDLLACNIFKNHNPMRNKNSKNYISKRKYPWDKWPPFCQGMAYLMSFDLIHKLNEGVRNPTKNQPFVWLDDVYITGMVINNLKLKLTNLTISYRLNADFKQLQHIKSLIFFQTNEMHLLWKRLHMLSPTK
ncbi:hypothetical protein LOTGIDRAFT_111415 [Lottia gigantea]|uniref:Hexosyltransferase n=1 Tax=Lottia gigantea TaxID=225164 RepID=V4B3K7_LOTGI|nr:hypothetical protein LOTGIDRAFT_111415 [Lottia gigantea]ESP01951.1 hypothetical protein LOTGIDRAFT_111415 [Lottia gigantea]